VEAFRTNCGINGCSEDLKLYYIHALAWKIRHPFAPPRFLPPAFIHIKPQASTVCYGLIRPLE
jgi:hypothetical protein